MLEQIELAVSRVLGTQPLLVHREQHFVAFVAAFSGIAAAFEGLVHV